MILDFAAYSLAAPIGGTMALTEVQHLSLWVRIGGLLYVLATVLAATIRRRDGAAIYLVGISVFFSSMMYTDLTVNGFVPRMGVSLDLMPLGMLVMLFSQLVIMAERWSGAIGAAEATSDELRQLLDINISIASEIQLEALLRQIVQVTSQSSAPTAARCSCTTSRPTSSGRWSPRASRAGRSASRPPRAWPAEASPGQAPSTCPTPMPTPASTAGRRAPPATSTRSVLTAPVTTRDGRRLGVMQALNRLDGEPFSETDVERMTAFGAQAAIAIENATLFAEVAAERNYNESILRSMSSGVITLDREQPLRQAERRGLRHPRRRPRGGGRSGDAAAPG